MKLSPEILALGRALVDQLGLDERNDMLSRWMAHDIAAKMDRAERLPDDPEAQTACADAILRLWDHRAVYPHPKRPYESLEPLLRTLEMLNPENDTPFYFRPNPGIEGEAAPWLKAALNFDASARVLITYVLGLAATASGKAASDWSGLAEAAGLRGSDVDLPRIILTAPSNPGPTADDVERERLKKLIYKLAAFQKTARMVAKEVKTELDRVGKSDDNVAD